MADEDAVWFAEAAASGSRGSHAVRSFSGIDVRAHACLMYARARDDEAATAAFVRRGLGEGDRVLCVAAPGRREALLRSLWDGNVDVRPSLACGQLQVLDETAAYLASGRFDARAMIALVEAEIAKAKDEGYRSLRITGEPASVDPELQERGELLEYERRVHAVFEEREAAALCRYHEATLDQALAEELAEIHSMAVCVIPGELALRTNELMATQVGQGVLAVRGELDASNAAAFADVLERAAAVFPEVCLEVSSLRFIDAAGMRSLYVAASLLGSQRGKLTLVGAGPAIRRAFDLVGWEPLEHLVIG